MRRIAVALDKDSLSFTDGCFVSIQYNYLESFINDDLKKLLDEDNFIDDFNDEFDTLLDWWEFEFLSSEKCGKLMAWSEKRSLNANCPALVKFYSTLKEYASLAVENRTGVKFDF